MWSAFWLLGFSPCIAWGASCWDWAWRCLRSVDTRNRPPRKSKTPSVCGWREVMRKAGSRFSARLIESRDKNMSHQNAIREGSEIRPALNAAHDGGFRMLRKRPDVIDSKWSGREDLNLRPPGPEPENSPFLKSGKIRNWKRSSTSTR